MSFPTLSGDGVEGMLLREPQVCLGPAFAQAVYGFFLSGSAFATPANVYQDGALTSPFPNTGVVNADSFGRFPPIYLDGSIIYGVQLTGSGGIVYSIDPYTPPLSTNGLSTNVAFGPQIASTGEVTLPAPAAGGSQITLKLAATVAGQACLQLNGTTPGQAALVINSSVTTGAQTATFTATNKPGPNITQVVLATAAPSGATYTGGTLTANWTGITSSIYSILLSTGQVIAGATFTNGSPTFTTPSTNITGTPSTTLQVTGPQASTPSGWLPVLADGVLYYTPIWHGDQFSPYVSNPAATGEMINAQDVTFGGNGATTPVAGTAIPSGWFAPLTANIGSGYYITITKVAGQPFNHFGTTAGGASIEGTPTNITSGGVTIVSTQTVNTVLQGTYTLSPNSSGTPIVASGTIQLSGNATGAAPGTGANDSVVYSGAANLVLNGNGTSTLNGVSTTNWFLPTTTNTGSGYWINISRTGGTTGVNFSAAQGAWTNIGNGFLAIGLTGAGSRNASGTYQISSNVGGTQVVASGTISLTAAGVNNTSWSGNAPLFLGGDGSSKLGGVANTNWFSPTTANTGSGYWIDINRTSGTSGVNFSVAQGSWTNITNTGLSISLSGTSGIVGTATATGSYGISNSATGSPVLGSGTITLNITGLTVIHVYTTGTGATETIPTGSTNAAVEGWAGGGSGGIGGAINPGGGGAAGGYARRSISVSGQAGHTFTYTVGAGGAASANPGNATSINAGTVTGWTNISCNGGGGGNYSAGASGGTASGGATNTTGASVAASTRAGATGTTGNISGDGSPYGGGGGGGLSNGQAGNAGGGGAVVFSYS